MAAARFSSDVLQTFYEPIQREENANLPERIEPERNELYDVLKKTQNNLQGWLHVWRMDVSPRNPHNKDLLRFARANKEKHTDLVKIKLK
jgi:hypothetical protein